MFKTLLFCASLLLLPMGTNVYSAATNDLTVQPIAPAVEYYYTVRPDYRKCIAPICGGWFISAVNLKSMLCPDGTLKSECYVAADTVRIPNLAPEQIDELHTAMRESRALLKGIIELNDRYGLLAITSAWLSANNQAAEGTFFSIRDNGIRCITSPCPSYDAEILNRNLLKSVAGFDLSQVNATPEQEQQAYAAVTTEDGLPVAGRPSSVSGPGGTAQTIIASQFYLKLVSNKPKICMPTGCSQQLCSDTPVVTSCEWRPEYACYQNATCSTQTNGECGWVMTEELRRCLASVFNGSVLKNTLARPQ